MNKEITFVGERIEIYVRLDLHARRVDAVYWDRRSNFPLERGGEEQVPSTDGANPMFVYAKVPSEAFRIADRDYNVTSGDELWLDAFKTGVRLADADSLREVSEVFVGSTIEIYEPVYNGDGNVACYKATGRRYTVAPACAIVGARTCFNAEGVKVRVAPSSMCEVLDD